jgi:hypothetical protein
VSGWIEEAFLGAVRGQYGLPRSLFTVDPDEHTWYVVDDPFGDVVDLARGADGVWATPPAAGAGAAAAASAASAPAAPRAD